MASWQGEANTSPGTVGVITDESVQMGDDGSCGSEPTGTATQFDSPQ